MGILQRQDEWGLTKDLMLSDEHLGPWQYFIDHSIFLKQLKQIPFQI